MYCDSCGVPLQEGQSFCQRCGKAVVGGTTPGSGRVARHAQMLGILWIAYSALLVMISLALMMVLRTVLPAIIRAEPPAGGPPPEVVLGFLHPLMMFIGVMLLAKALAGIAAGIGILQRADWSRMLAIVVACISLLSVPFGTAIGVYTLWVLLSPNAAAEFRGQGRAAVV